MEFIKLLDAIVPSGSLRNSISELLERKKDGQELDSGPRIEVISNFIETELNRLSKDTLNHPESVASIEELNELFREILEEVGSDKKK